MSSGETLILAAVFSAGVLAFTLSPRAERALADQGTVGSSVIFDDNNPRAVITCVHARRANSTQPY